MRTTIILPDGLYDQVKKSASEKSITISAFLERAIRKELQTLNESPPKKKIFPATGEGGTHPGIDISDSRTINEILDTDLNFEQLR